MKTPSHDLGIDLETFSAADIKSVGSYRYIDDPTFEVMLLSFAWDDEPVELIDITAGEKIPKDFLDALTHPDVGKTAWNCAFERSGLWKHTGIYLPPEQWYDSMILAAVCGLPMSLGGAGKALGLPEDAAKDKAGKALIKYFCTPCKPTKTNGGRTRNRPEDAPEKWEEFRSYNKQDVVAERTIRRMLQRWTPDETEHKFWCLDARINEKGMGVDLQMVRHAIDFDARYKADLTQQAIALTGMENPNSVAQIKAWLMDQEGIAVPSLNKKAVADVVAQLSTDKAKEFMALRARLAKSSTKKYEAMERTACSDGHTKGCFQFYGASRTGRFAGRNVQLQNLTKHDPDSMPDIDWARQLVRSGDYEGLEQIYDDVSGTLSALVRTALIPEDGCQFLVADFSAIEARVTAWLAGEEWRLDTFEQGGDIYCASASQMFKVPVVKHGVNGHLRQKGKVAELACIAEDELVLTDVGLVPIQNVTTEMRVWDGSSWVHHDGVVCNGIKEVIEYDGLKATADHLVWVEGEPRPIHFGVAAARGAHLRHGFDSWKAIRERGDYLPRKTVGPNVEPLLRPNAVRPLRHNAMDRLRELTIWKKQRLSVLFSTEEDPQMARQKTDCRKAAMRKSERAGIQKLRRPWDPLQLPKRNRGGALDDRESWPAGSQDGNRPDRHQRELRSRKSALGNALRELLKHAQNGTERVRSAVLALFVQHCDPKAQCGVHAGRDYRAGGGCCGGAAEKLARYCGPTRVYDIRNAGPHHRFTVSGVLVHNCGYGGGVGALKAFGADKLGMTDEEMVQTIDQWREASPRICEFWKSLENAAIRCVVKRIPTRSKIGGIRFDMEQGILWMTLPSGRRIAYYGAEYRESKFRKGKTLTYMGTEQQSRKWTRLETWGGKLVENCVQATSRDILREAMLALDAAGYDIRAHVHDEVIISEPIGGRTFQEVADLMGQPIPWAPGLPLRADGYACPYYMKD